MTFGLDQGWRRFAVEQVSAGLISEDLRVLDVGTGTGDFLPMLRRALPHATVVGVDFSLPMMRAGRAKNAPTGPGGFAGGDAMCLPFADGTFDAVTTGFAMRNVADLPTALAELRRVARPGARMACLEVAQPAWAPLRLGHRWYFNLVVPLIGAVLTGHPQAYSYLPQSAARFPSPPQLSRLLVEAGWRNPCYRLLGFGAVAVHTVEK
jgi:demethylmenaquinone methyltransferase/2-methoxy-6-polyprenyl-1,4-benzoquinol methylase